MLKLCQRFISNYSVHNYRFWFNQYEPGVDECFIHCHQGATISGVYYVELDKKKDATVFGDQMQELDIKFQLEKVMYCCGILWFHTWHLKQKEQRLSFHST